MFVVCSDRGTEGAVVGDENRDQSPEAVGDDTKVSRQDISFRLHGGRVA